jgi:hypothetical protein
MATKEMSTGKAVWVSLLLIVGISAAVLAFYGLMVIVLSFWLDNPLP